MQTNEQTSLIRSHDDNDRVQSLASAAYDSLLHRIMSGDLPGGTIVEEKVLVADFGISRTPLREALGRLRGEGFLTRQGRKLLVHHVTERDFIEILQLRRILETEAVAMATPRLQPSQIKRMRSALLSLMAPGDHSPESRWQVDDLLHKTIAEASGNSRLAHAILDLRPKTKPLSVRLMVERGYSAIDFNEHMAILEAIEARDVDRARNAMLAHINSARSNILRKLGEV